MEEIAPFSSGIPQWVIDMKEELTVQTLKARADITELGKRNRFTQTEAARLAECGVQTVKDAVAAGKLKVGGSGWITRPQLEDWLGYDPIEDRYKQILKFERQSIALSKLIESLFVEPIQNHPNPSNPVKDVEPTAESCSLEIEPVL